MVAGVHWRELSADWGKGLEVQLWSASPVQSVTIPQKLRAPKDALLRVMCTTACQECGARYICICWPLLAYELCGVHRDGNRMVQVLLTTKACRLAICCCNLSSLTVHSARSASHLFISLSHIASCLSHILSSYDELLHRRI